MAVYGSGSIRFDGLGGDTNFSEMIEKLYKVESRQVNQLLRWKSEWSSRITAFDQVRTSLNEMQTALKKINTMTKFMSKNAVSSDTKVGSAIAEADCVDGAYTLEVNRLASNSSWSKSTGLYNSKDVICEGDPGTFEYSYKGKTRSVSVPKGTTVEGLLNLINKDSKNPGVKAQVISSKNGLEFMLRGNETGDANTLVIRKTEGIKGLDVNLSPGNYDEEESQIKLISRTFTTGTEVINSSSEEKSFIYSVGGKQYTVMVPAGEDIDYLIGEINTQHPGPPPLASRDGGYFTLKKDDTTYNYLADTEYDKYITSQTFTSSEALVNESGSADATLKLTVSPDPDDGTDPYDIEIIVPPNTKLSEVRKMIADKFGDKADVTLAETASGSNDWRININVKPTVHRVDVGRGTLEEFKHETRKDPSWTIAEGQDAQVKINGWPPGDDKWYEHSSNTLEAGKVWPGITFNLHDKGKTVITTSVDTAKIQENIYAFCTAINDVRVVLNELTKVEDTKETIDLNYAENQFEMQKGSVLTGNYGIQMIESKLKNAVSGSAIGFQHRKYDTDGSLLGGDLFTSLSQIGIFTNADEGDAMYGMLDIVFTDGEKGSKSLEQALKEDPDAVVKLFAADNLGYSDSTNVNYSSHISRVTKPGNYDIEYTSDASGQIISATINGKEAKYDADARQIIGLEGDAKGLAVDVLVIEANTTQSGRVSIQQGKVNEILGLLEGTEGFLGSSGTLKNLERNYKGIMDGIEEKITREDERLAKWERTMINKFARLEAVLAKYNNINDGLQAQISSLSTGSKK